MSALCSQFFKQTRIVYIYYLFSCEFTPATFSETPFSLVVSARLLSGNWLACSSIAAPIGLSLSSMVNCEILKPMRLHQITANQNQKIVAVTKSIIKEFNVQNQMNYMWMNFEQWF